MRRTEAGNASAFPVFPQHGGRGGDAVEGRIQRRDAAAGGRVMVEMRKLARLIYCAQGWKGHNINKYFLPGCIVMFQLGTIS